MWHCLRLLSQSTGCVDQICLYGIKIRLETPEIKVLSVALLSQARKSDCDMAHNTLVVLVFVRTVSIPNFSLLPCLEVAANHLCQKFVVGGWVGGGGGDLLKCSA